MIRFFTACAVAAFSVAAAAQTASGPPPQSGPELKVGDPAPDFALPGSDGKTHKLSDYKGTTVVLAWFPKAFTGGWTAECNALRESGPALKDFDVAYFMVSVDPPDVNKAFAEQEHADFPILSDPAKTTATAYGVVTPERQMAARWTFYIGPDGKILDIDKKVSVRSAGSDAIAKLEALGVKKKKR